MTERSQASSDLLYFLAWKGTSECWPARSHDAGSCNARPVPRQLRLSPTFRAPPPPGRVLVATRKSCASSPTGQCG
jgi:hypothetical protein